MKTYRCTACNEMKNTRNTCFKPWADKDCLVGICRGCNAKMKKLGLKLVVDFKMLSKPVGLVGL